MTSTFKLSALMAAIALTTACSSGGGGSDDSNDQANSRQIKGALIAPELPKQNAEALVARAFQAARYARASNTSSCSEVPAGYVPLSNLDVSVTDADGVEVASFKTDACGAFSLDVPKTAQKLKAESDQYEPIEADVLAFEAVGTQPDAIVSALPKGAKYRISTVQSTGNAAEGYGLAFTVTDDTTGKAVIGLAPEVVSVTLADQPVTLESFGNAYLQSEDASVALVLDASSSMSSYVYDEQYSPIQDDDGNFLTRFDLTSLAAHTFIEGKGNNDEVHFVIFDHKVIPIDGADFNHLFVTHDVDGTVVDYDYAANGFEKRAEQLHFVADLYNYNSSYYGSYKYAAKHPLSPDLQVSSSYPWYGSTAMWSAIETALENLAQAGYSRQLVIAMTDGADNASGLTTPQKVVERAQALGVPVFMIAFGSASREADMKLVAEQTNGSYQNVHSLDIADLYQSIQTGVRFQYLAGLDGVQSGDELVLKVTMPSGDTVERSLMLRDH